jgi:hypothetical protein
MKARTRSTPFYDTSDAPASLLTVQAGVAIDVAIEEAGNIVNAALDTLKGVACGLSVEDGGKDAWTAIYALEVADGLLHAVSAGLLDLERPEPTAKPAPAPEAKPEDPEAMRRVWTDLAEMAAAELAKLDRASETKEGA